MKWLYDGKVYIEQPSTHLVKLMRAKGDFEGAHPGGYLLHRDRIKPLFSQYLIEVEECAEIADTTILPLKSIRE